MTKAWYGVSVLKRPSPFRFTLKVPSRLSRRSRACVATTVPNPRSRVSSSFGSVAGWVVGVIGGYR